MTDPQTPPASPPSQPADPYRGTGSPPPTSPPVSPYGSSQSSAQQPLAQQPDPQPTASVLGEQAGQPPTQRYSEQWGESARQQSAATDSRPGGYDEAAYSRQADTEPPRGLSIASMVLGVLSLVFGFSVVVPILGFVLGSIALKREPEGRAFAIAGLWLNGVVLLLGLVVLIIVIVALSIGAFTIPVFLDTNAAVLNA